MTADPNPYRSPASASRNMDSGAGPRGLWATRGFLVGVIQAALWLALGAITVNVAQEFAKIFHDFDAELPGMTIFFIGFAHFLGHYWYLAVLVIVSWPLVNCGIVTVLSPRPDVVIPRRLWYVVTWAALALVVPLAVVALLVPLTGLIPRSCRNDPTVSRQRDQAVSHPGGAAGGAAGRFAWRCRLVRTWRSSGPAARARARS